MTFLQNLQFNKQPQGGSINTSLINPDDFDMHLLLLSSITPSPPPPPHCLSEQLMRHIASVLLLLIYDAIRTGL